MRYFQDLFVLDGRIGRGVCDATAERLLREREMRRTQSSVSLDHSARELEFGSRAASYVAQAHSHSNPNMTPTPAHLYAVGSAAGASAAAASLEAVYRHSVFPPHGIQEGWDNEEGEDWQECEMQRPGSLPTHLHPRLPAARLGSRKSSFDSSAGTGICSPPTTAEHLQHTPQVPLSGGGGKASRRSSQAFSAPSSGDGVQRLLVVANRLPVSARLAPDGTWFLEVNRTKPFCAPSPGCGVSRRTDPPKSARLLHLRDLLAVSHEWPHLYAGGKCF